MSSEEDRRALESLTAAAFARTDESVAVDLDELCQDHPHLKPRLEALLATRRRIRESHVRPKEWQGRGQLIGSTLMERYAVEQRIGSGAMGIVYHGIDTSLEREVAIKVLAAPFLDSTQATDRFEREARALASLDHPAIVRVFDRGQADTGEEFLVMELLRGRTLQDVLRNEGDECLSKREFSLSVVRWIAQLADGLEASHQAGVIHRDIKPSNLFIREDDTAAILDFGLAARMDQSSITRTGSPVGTLAYLAPEALNAKKRVDVQADIYGLTASLYRAVAGKPPHTGSPSQIAVQLTQFEPTPVRKLAPWIDSTLAGVIEKGMQKNPADRYSSARDLAQDLRAYLAGEPTIARPISPLGRGLRRLKRSRTARLLAALGTGASLILGAGAWRDANAAARNAGYWDAVRRLPVNFDIVGLENRLVHQDEERHSVEALLDTAAELRVAPLPTLAVRAAFYLDGDDADRATAEMDLLAREVGTPYAASLALAYRSFASAGKSSTGPDLDALPQPSTPEDLYLAGYHALRSFDYAQAQEFLFDERASHLIYVQELRAILLSSKPAQLQESAHQIEAIRGSRSATSAHLLGYSLKLLHRPEAAMDVYLSGLALSPTSFVLLENAGGCAFDMGDATTAQDYLQRVLELRPKMLRPQSLLVQSFLLEGDSDGAETALATTLIGTEPEHAAMREELLGEADAVRMLASRLASESAASQEHASNAVAHFEAAAALGRSVKSGRSQLARALALGDEPSALEALFLRARQRPLSLPVLQNLRSWIAQEPATDSRTVKAFIPFLDALIGALRQRAAVDERALLNTFPGTR